MTDAIVLRGIRKTFGDKVAVDDLDLVVPQGAMYGVIGPNGAGKTTAIRAIMSIQFPDRGEVRVLGHASALDAKDRIGYLPEERGVYRKMRVGAFLEYMARLKGRDGPDVGRRVKAWLERVGLPEVEKRRCDELSKGMQQKIQFLAAIVHEPDLVILDEPFSGLDPVNMRLLRDLVLEQHQRGATVLFSTHVMVQAEQLCDHIVMIHGGKKVLDASLGEIRNAHAARALLFEPFDAAADIAPLRALPGVREVLHGSAGWEIGLQPGADPAAVLRRVVDTVTPARIEILRPTLEDVFVDIVTGDAAAAAEDAAHLRAHLRDNGAAAPIGKAAP